MTDTPPETVTEKRARKAALIMKRRELVARLDARGLSQREIVTALEKERILDDKGKPFSVMAVNRDLKLIYAERIKRLQDARVRNQARVYGKILEAQRMAWGQEDVRAVQGGIKQEIDLLGLDAVDAAEVDWLKAMTEAGFTKEEALNAYEAGVRAAVEKLRAEKSAAGQDD